jgi:hypothetical protein
MVGVSIEEMFGSDGNRPLDYERTVLVEANQKDNEGSRRRSVLKREFDTADIVRDIRFALIRSYAAWVFVWCSSYSR